ncbi:hypothetical protein [Streptomyces sp. NPDC060131]|uniref:hypothetical protein n=1 Tax=Streptomyces sp. NPDC060131 TaxID=3347058 RepID=UPI003668BBB2
MGNSDTHVEGQIGIPHTVVFAEELSTAAILAGIRAGRSWIAESADVEVSFTAHADGRVAGVGEQLTTRGGQVAARTSPVILARPLVSPGHPASWPEAPPLMVWPRAASSARGHGHGRLVGMWVRE